ncbi:KAP family P-loop NTPase fold protein [bacterium endosymbiont of Bathymodiolus sp. 5 South]|jgi:hypothetical protein|uniref:KAP family P-loop NTPase fold protein n=1 Tax=bacterium endosymbiont of Bathymodiolus sp. 5 South TaxID=1181670 RepID=UPI0010B9E522|nr:P-loop NTPase fold protein [bacterium endosymbiont of Bathymodiolus sp. 5 South]SHN93362.1 Putative phage protein [bacterium endosymbiont of Bathymodiolus sp. 5 South]
MITINKPIKIPDHDIFKNDLLDRKGTIEDLSNLIVSDIQPFVFSVNADWGAGKTTFIKLWQAHLKESYKVKSIYFSAWEDDFTSDPLIAILGELKAYIEENHNELKNNFEDVKKTGGKIIRNSLPLILKGVAGKVIGDETVAKMVSDFVENSTTALIDNYQKEKTTLEKFKNSIAKILKKIDKGQPFIVFIDELDRCRPLYAIECLERIKHIFGIKRLIFVLSIDKKNLAKSIQSQYGNIDTNNYLRRFIDLEFDLKNPSIDKFCDVLCQKFELNNILENKEISTNGVNEGYGYLFAMKTFAASFKLSLRQVEQIFTKLRIIFRVIQHRIFFEHFLVLALFESLKSYDNNLYLGLINGKEEDKKTIKALIVTIKDEELQDRGLEMFETRISAIIDATTLSDDQLNDLIKQKEEELSTIGDENSREYSKFYNYIKFLKRSFDKYDTYRYNQITKTVINKIDFADRFNLDERPLHK